VSEHQLFLFLVDVAVLFLAARLGGELAARIGIPLHVGELVFGIMLGPSMLGWIAPNAFDALFPAEPTQRALLDVFSWTGVVMLVLIGGLEARLGILARARAAVIGSWIGGFTLPFAAGFALGMVFPEALVPTAVGRPVFALFLATAMSISAIPVIARILMDLDLFRTRTGSVIIAAAVADDTIGWIVLSVVTGLAAGGVAVGSVARTILLTAAFVGLALTVGRLVVDRALSLGSRLRVPHSNTSMVFAIVLGFAAITQAIGVHLVLGAFVAALLIGRSGKVDRRTVAGLREIGMGFFVPFFFAYTGIKVDLTMLRGSALAFTVVAVIVACLGKIVGGGLGARLGGLPKWEAVAVGVGLNARGAMELVIASIGLSVGVLNEATYAMVVLIAVFTTVMTAPLLRWCIGRAGPSSLDEASVAIETDVDVDTLVVA
jgi:Kef-type K+ transport system membrane component KefB